MYTFDPRTYLTGDPSSNPVSSSSFNFVGNLFITTFFNFFSSSPFSFSTELITFSFSTILSSSLTFSLT
ncbi:hypothetical protein Hanom_Chr02g00170081 [Helianthus anomalus]